MREARVVAVMSLGFGLVGIDRFLISTLYPVIALDLHLGYGDIGLITGALAIAWGIAALLMGNLSDRVGRRGVLAGSLVVFSLLIGLSGLATGLATLVGVRVLMGFADGAYTPVSIASTLHASAPRRRGLNIGIQQMMMPLFGLGFAPLFVAYVLQYVAWRWVFLFFVLPGLALALAAWRVLPASRDTPRDGSGGSLRAWRAVLGFRNVRIAALMMLCWLTCLITTSAFLPNYLVDFLHLRNEQMGIVMSAIGLGASAGTLVLPWLSDRIGRRQVMLLSSACVLASLLLLRGAGGVGTLFACLFAVHFFNNALIALTVGPLSAGSVPVSLMATASGLVIAVGELFGGGIAPVIVGRAAQQFGIEHVLWLPVATIGIGFLLSFAIRSARPVGVVGREEAFP